MSNAESSDSPQVKFILELCQAFSKKDIDFVAKNLHKDYRRNTYPRSLGKQDQTKEEWLEEFGGVLDLWAKNELIADSFISVPGKVIFHATKERKTLTGIDINLESLYIVHVITEGDGNLKVKQVEEFVDSKAHLDGVQAIAAAGAKK